MGWFGGPGSKSSREPEYSPILTPAGRSDRCQRHRGLNGQPTGRGWGRFLSGPGVEISQLFWLGRRPREPRWGTGFRMTRGGERASVPPLGL